MNCIVTWKFHDKNGCVLGILWIFFLFFLYTTYSRITENGVNTEALVSLRISLFKQCIYNSVYLIYKWAPWICSIFKQSNLKTSVARVNPDRAEKPAGKNRNLAYLAPIIFCPAASAAKTVRQISPGSAELSVLPSLSCQQPPTRQVPDDWLKTEADEWWNCWVTSAGGEFGPAFALGFPPAVPQSANYPNGCNSPGRQAQHDSGPGWVLT